MKMTKLMAAVFKTAATRVSQKAPTYVAVTHDRAESAAASRLCSTTARQLQGQFLREHGSALGIAVAVICSLVNRNCSSSADAAINNRRAIEQCQLDSTGKQEITGHATRQHNMGYTLGLENRNQFNADADVQIEWIGNDNMHRVATRGVLNSKAVSAEVPSSAAQSA